MTAVVALPVNHSTFCRRTVPEVKRDLPFDMDSLEVELAEKLFDWRSRDANHSSGPIDKPSVSKNGDRKRRKRKHVKSAVDPDTTSLAPILPHQEPSSEQLQAVLSHALITPRAGSDWSEIPQTTRVGKDLGVVKKRKKASGSKRGEKSRYTELRDRRANASESGVNAASFVEQHRYEVGALGSSGLNKREKKAYESAQLLRLGCRAPRNQKMPIGMLIGMRKKQKERDQKEKEKKLEEGVLISSKRKKR